LNCGHIAGSCTLYKKRPWPKYVCSYNNLNIYTQKNESYADLERVQTLLKSLKFDSIQWTEVNKDPTEIDYFFSTYKCTIFKKTIDTKTQYWIQMHPLTNRIYFLFEYITETKDKCIFYRNEYEKIQSCLLNNLQLTSFKHVVEWCRERRHYLLGEYLREISHYNDCTFVAEQFQAQKIYKQIEKDLKRGDNIEYENNFNPLFFHSGIEVNMLLNMLLTDIKEITTDFTDRKIQLLKDDATIQEQVAVFTKKLKHFVRTCTKLQSHTLTTYVDSLYGKINANTYDYYTEKILYYALVYIVSDQYSNITKMDVDPDFEEKILTVLKLVQGLYPDAENINILSCKIIQNILTNRSKDGNQDLFHVLDKINNPNAIIPELDGDDSLYNLVHDSMYAELTDQVYDHYFANTSINNSMLKYCKCIRDISAALQKLNFTNDVFSHIKKQLKSENIENSDDTTVTDNPTTQRIVSILAYYYNKLHPQTCSDDIFAQRDIWLTHEKSRKLDKEMKQIYECRSPKVLLLRIIVLLFKNGIYELTVAIAQIKIFANALYMIFVDGENHVNQSQILQKIIQIWEYMNVPET
jgi:hypothetical protein